MLENEDNSAHMQTEITMENAPLPDYDTIACATGTHAIKHSNFTGLGDYSTIDDNLIAVAVANSPPLTTSIKVVKGPSQIPLYSVVNKTFKTKPTKDDSAYDLVVLPPEPSEHHEESSTISDRSYDIQTKVIGISSLASDPPPPIPPRTYEMNEMNGDKMGESVNQDSSKAKSAGNMKEESLLVSNGTTDVDRDSIPALKPELVDTALNAPEMTPGAPEVTPGAPEMTHGAQGSSFNEDVSSFTVQVSADARRHSYETADMPMPKLQLSAALSGNDGT